MRRRRGVGGGYTVVRTKAVDESTHASTTSHSQQLQAAHKDHPRRHAHVNVIPEDPTPFPNKTVPAHIANRTWCMCVCDAAAEESNKLQGFLWPVRGAAGPWGDWKHK